jgi:ketosteroid isomerase-like protein
VGGSNVVRFRRAIDAINRGDAEGLVEGAAEDVLFLPARSEVMGPFRGHDGLRRFVAENAESFDIFTYQLTEVRDLGDRLFVDGRLRVRGRGGQVETVVDSAGVATYDDAGRLIRWDDYRERRLALAAAGLSE